jgi:hypothetical protein
MYNSRVASEKFGLVAHILAALIGLTEVGKSPVNFDRFTSLVGLQVLYSFVLLVLSVMKILCSRVFALLGHYYVLLERVVGAL